MDSPDRDRKLADWHEGLLSDPEAAELLAELRGDSEFCQAAVKEVVVRRFLAAKRIPEGDFSRQVLDTLRTDERDSLANKVITRLQRRQSRQRGLFWASIGIAAAAMLVAGFFLVSGRENQDSGIRIIAAEGVGTLDTDAMLEGREITLRNGILELDLNREARVVFESPVKFRLLSPSHIVLREGRCFAEMEKGRSGLLIETPSGNVLDLGTKFAIDVSSSEEMEVHVFEGEVEVTDRKRKRLVRQGNGLSVKSSGELENLVAARELFVSRVPRESGIPAPYVHWSFDEGSGRTVHANDGQGNRGTGDGRLIAEDANSLGPTWVDGVFGNALEFSGEGEWVDTDHPGVSGSDDRTVVCWVKLPSDWGGPNTASMIAWGSTEKRNIGQGWKFAVGRGSKAHPERTGRLYLSLSARSVVGTTDLRDGRWHHVAAVAVGDQETPTFLFYVDGQLENVARNTVSVMQTETTEEDAETVRFGHQFYRDDQFMRGSLDEVYIFETPLSGDQIRALMRGESVFDSR